MPLYFFKYTQLTFNSMSEQSSRGIINLVYTLLIVLGFFMHMSISGMEVGSLIIGIFTESGGFVTFISAIFSWLFNFFVNVQIIYMLGTALIMWFVVLPLMVRYRYIQVRVNGLLALTVTLYLFLPLKMYGFVPM